MMRVKLFVSFLVLASSISPTLVHADQITPEGTVRELVLAVRSDNSERIDNLIDEKKLQSHQRHSLTKEGLVKLLRNVDPGLIKFEPRKPDLLVVRMIQPRSLDFELISIQTESKPSTKYRIVGIHP